MVVRKRDKLMKTNIKYILLNTMLCTEIVAFLQKLVESKKILCPRKG